MEAYLDYNATTPVDPQVFEEMRPYLTHEFGNASSFHKKGQAARHAIEQARERIADTLAVEPGDLIFTSGGTEADNLAIQGVMKYFESQRKHLVISAIEHQAVLAPALHFLKRGLKVTVIPVDKQGVVDLNFLEKSVTSDTALVSVMHVNNEVGTIQPIKAIAQIAHKKGALFHTDAVQSLGKITLDIASVDPDMVSCSAHKIYGPKGAGALYLKKGVKLKPMIRGGHQEKNIRPGTENVAAIAGFGKAAERLGQSPEKEKGRVLLLRNQLYEGLKKNITGMHLNGHETDRIYNTLNVSFENLDGEMLLMNLDLKNIYAATGSACTSGSVEPSHVLSAMGVPEKLARAAVRFSVGRFTTHEEIDYALSEIAPIIERLRKSSTTHAH